jgi:prephenate dehydratase
MSPKLAYLGPEFSYHYLASLQLKNSLELVGCNSFETIFENVKNKQTNYGIIAVENSLTGSLKDNLKTIFDLNLSVVAEIQLSISHCLVTSNSNPNFSQKTQEISSQKQPKIVYSHQKALEQCSNLITKNNYQMIVTNSTSEAGNMIKALDDPSCLAIVSPELARHLNLKILQKNIGNNKNNWTRFLVITNNQSDNPSQLELILKRDFDKMFPDNQSQVELEAKYGLEVFDSNFELEKVFKTSIRFCNFSPNQLITVLKEVEELSKVTKIETMNRLGSDFEYDYYIDLVISESTNYDKLISNLRQEFKFQTLGKFRFIKTSYRI